ncbi:MAG: WG repeat-containing protein [Clostridiales bacterium]|jgi:hypothetical protein|nr:WG repeat-containing protein [Clostridiales bacterium]
MKRYLLCFFICILLLFACACEEQEPVLLEDGPDRNEPKIEFSRPTFYLEALPELAPYEVPREIISRYGKEEFVDTLKPAKDYGRLYPYEGKFIGGNWWEGIRYGLTDAKGRIVVDPVYSQAYYVDREEGKDPAYLMLAYPTDKRNEEPQKPGEDPSDFIQRGRFVFASADGSWVSDTFYGEGAHLSEDRIIIYDYDNPQDIYLGKRSFSMYDLKGRLIAKGDGTLHGFQEGLSVVRHSSHNRQGDSYSEYCDYIDKNGNVLIPGPFLSADSFVNGLANVTIGEDWEHQQEAVIDTQGNFRGSSNSGGLRYDTFGDYIYFSEYNEGYQQEGIMDKNGNIMIPANYTWISRQYESAYTLVTGRKEDDSYWIIDPKSGGEKKIDLAGVQVRHANISGDGWCEVSYEKDLGNGIYLNGLALLKGETEYRFEQEDSYVNCSYLQNDLFAVSYNKSNQNHSSGFVEIFSTALGEAIKRIEGYNFNYKIDDTILVFYSIGGSRQLLLGNDFEPAFSPADLGSDYIKRIDHLADDVYKIRTNLYSGLIKENGQWLIRVYANNMD